MTIKVASKVTLRDFPDGPVVKTPELPLQKARVPYLVSQGAKIPHAVQRGPPQK